MFSFDGVGFGLAFTASFLSGARWTFSQKVLQKSKLNLHNPIDFIYHIQPMMILTILPLAIYVEGKKNSAPLFQIHFENLQIRKPDIQIPLFLTKKGPRMAASEFGFRFSTPETLSKLVLEV